METEISSDEVQAEKFIELLRQAAKQGYSEQLAAQLQECYVNAPSALPLVAKKLLALRPTPEYTGMIRFLIFSGTGFDQKNSLHFAPVMREPGAALPNAIYLCRLAQRNGHENHYVSAAIDAMKHAYTLHDQWIVMRHCVFCLNNLGHHRRAQTCALIAYQIAQKLEDVALQQRSRFSVLNSTRMVGNANVILEYQRELKDLHSGKLLYSGLSHSLLPTYTAMHLMDLCQDDRIVTELLLASNEAVIDSFTQLNNKIAWARYHNLSGRSSLAKTQIHELAEEYRLSIVDAPDIRPLLSLARELGVAGLIAQPPITKAPEKLWHQFDMAVDRLWKSVVENSRS